MCNSIFCIIPPHVLNEIIARGDEDHRQWAIQTLTSTARLQGHRDILNRYDLSNNKNHGLFRVIQSAANKQKLPGVVVRKEGQGLTGDPAVDEAYAYIGNVYNFYKTVFKRNSINGKGEKLFATVHYGKNFDNAFWDGERMVYGDGDGRIFQIFTKCLEVVGHEQTHGITQLTSNLTYESMSGALNEANSDVMGSLVKQFTLNQTAHQADWIIGEGLLEPSINGVGIRSIKAPGTAYDDPLLGKDPCPASMNDYVQTTEDNGGIHINCTIPSHAFYVSSIELGGYAWQRMGRIWYNVNTTQAGSNPTFVSWANMTLATASRMFGNGSLEYQATEKGWKEVGVL